MPENKEEKKKFFDTKLGKFTQKLGKAVPSIIEAGLGVATGTVPLSAVGDLLFNKSQEETDPQKKEELDTAYWEFKNSELEFEAEMSTLRYGDRANARQRQIEMYKLGSRSPLMLTLGFGMLLCYIGLLLALIFMEIPEANKDQLIHMEGIMEGGLLAMISYYFGDSQRSEKK